MRGRRSKKTEKSMEPTKVVKPKQLKKFDINQIPPSDRWKHSIYLDKVDELINGIQNNKPGCEIRIPHSKKSNFCIVNTNKDCKEEKKSCDKFVKAYHTVCDLINPYTDLVYKKNYDELDKMLSELSYTQIETLIEQSEMCLTMRKFHLDECIDIKCHDSGHEKQIVLVYQVFIAARNKLTQIEREYLAELYLNDKISLEDYNAAIQLIPTWIMH